jgi:4-hydroxybenzoate polyprenyltransferase
MPLSATIKGYRDAALSWWQELQGFSRTLRPQQWVKNLFVLVPLLFAQHLFEPIAVARAVIAFFCFCLISSSVYVLNDLKDREHDRLHPQKRYRPLAAGELSVGVACGGMVALLLVALAGGLLLDPTLALIFVSYWLINLLYSIWLKHQVILDVFAIASGFVLRVIGGAVVIEVEMSHWLLLCATLLALFLGFSKRRHEIGLLGELSVSHRQVLEQYSQSFLDMIIGIVTAATVMSYALYTVSEETVRRFHTKGLLLTLPFVLYGIFRYLYLIYQKDQGGDPTQNLLTDRGMMINICLWVVVTGILLYWR